MSKENELDETVQYEEITEEDMKRGQEVDEYVKEHGKTPTVEKYIKVTLSEGEAGTIIDTVYDNMTGEDFFLAIGSLSVQLNKNTGIEIDKILEDLKSFYEENKG